MPITYHNTSTRRVVKVPTPQEAASRSSSPKRAERRQKRLILKMDESSRWERVGSLLPARPLQGSAHAGETDSGSRRDGKSPAARADSPAVRTDQPPVSSPEVQPDSDPPKTDADEGIELVVEPSAEGPKIRRVVKES